MNKIREIKRQRRLRRQSKRAQFETDNSYVFTSELRPRKNIQPNDAHHIVKRARVARIAAAIEQQKKELGNAKDVASKFKATA